MTNDFSLLFKKYSVPAIFSLIGILMIIMGLATDPVQGTTWFVSSLMVFVSGVITILHSSGSISKRLALMLGIGSGLASAVVLISTYFTITNQVKFNEDRDLSTAQTEQHLTDVRTAQKCFVDHHRTYAKTWEELEEFVKNGMVDELISEGTVPVRTLTIAEYKMLYKGNPLLDNNMKESEALKLSKMSNPAADLMDFRRDTIKVSVFKKFFSSRSYLETRAKLGLGKLDVKDLRYVPFTDRKGMFKMETKDSIPGGTGEPLLMVTGKYPMPTIVGAKPEAVSFGSLVIPGLSGTWEGR